MHFFVKFSVLYTIALLQLITITSIKWLFMSEIIIHVLYNLMKCNSVLVILSYKSKIIQYGIAISIMLSVKSVTV